MDERIDLLDADGNLIGKTALKSKAHKNGWFHQTVHIWFYTSDGMILLQKRGKAKETYPLLWDVSVAGHIGAGEGIEISALREIKEEIGLTISQDQLEKVGVFKSIQKHNNNLLDYEFHHTYICELKVSLKNLEKQKSEVEDLKLISLDQFSEETSEKNNHNEYVPHNSNYYKEIIKSVKERL